MNLLDKLLKRTFIAGLLFTIGVIIPLSYWNIHRRAEERIRFLAVTMLEQLKSQTSEGDLVSLQKHINTSAFALIETGEPLEVRLTRLSDDKLIADLKSDQPIYLPIQRTIQVESLGYGRMQLSLRLDARWLVIEHAALALVAVGFLFVLLTGLRRRLFHIRNAMLQMEIDAEMAKMASQFAHDVRSPLSALRIVVMKLKSQNSELSDLTEMAMKRIETIGSELLSEYRKKHASSSIQPVLDLQAEIEARFPSRTKWFLTTPNFDRLSLSPESLARVIQNLVVNSIESTPNTKAHVIMKQSSRALEITVSDDGLGFPVEIIDSIEKRQFKTTKANGTGLGLRTVIEIIEKSNGKLKILNGLPGAIVQITVPNKR